MLLKKKAKATTAVEAKEVVKEVSPFTADLELAEYQYRVETGQLTEQEKADRERILKFLGYET